MDIEMSLRAIEQQRVADVCGIRRANRARVLTRDAAAAGGARGAETAVRRGSSAVESVVNVLASAIRWPFRPTRPA